MIQFVQLPRELHRSICKLAPSQQRIQLILISPALTLIKYQMSNFRQMSNFNAVTLLTPHIPMNSQTSLRPPQGTGFSGGTELMGIVKRMRIPWKIVQGPRGRCRQCHRTEEPGKSFREPDGK